MTHNPLKKQFLHLSAVSLSCSVQLCVECHSFQALCTLAFRVGLSIRRGRAHCIISLEWPEPRIEFRVSAQTPLSLWGHSKACRGFFLSNLGRDDGNVLLLLFYYRQIAFLRLLIINTTYCRAAVWLYIWSLCLWRKFPVYEPGNHGPPPFGLLCFLCFFAFIPFVFGHISLWLIRFK